MPTTTEDRKVAITGIVADKTMLVEDEIGKNCTIGMAVGKLGFDIACIISNLYNLQPPLNPFAMCSSYYPSGKAFSKPNIYYSH